MRWKTRRCPVNAVQKRRLQSRPLRFGITLDLTIHNSGDKGWFVTAVIKFLDIAHLGNAVIDLKVGPNLSAD